MAALLIAVSCVSETGDAEPTEAPAPPSPAAPEVAPSPAPQPPAGPPDGWVSVADLPEVEIAEVPASADWATDVRRTRIEGWRLGRRGSHLPRGPHTNIAGLFATKSNAKAFYRRGELVPASNGTCFKFVWPTPDRTASAGEIRDEEPVLMPEPHVFHRARWDSFVAWAQGTRWLGVSEDGNELQLEITEAWLHVTKLKAERIATQQVTFRRLDEAPEGFALFGARQDERVHVVAVALDDGGALSLDVLPPERPPPGSKEAILNPPRLRGGWPCAYQRFAVDPPVEGKTAAPRPAYRHGETESPVLLRMTLEDYAGEAGLLVPSD